MDLSVQVTDVQDDDRAGDVPWAVARVAGDLDISSAPVLRERLVACLIGGRPRVVLDLTDVGFLDSTGLGVVVGLLKRARTLGGDLRLVCPASSVRKVFEITALDRTLPPADTVEEAIAQGNDRAG